MSSSRIHLFIIILAIGSVASLNLLAIDTGTKGKLGWDIQFKRIENCKDKGTGEIDMDLRLRKVSRTRVDMEGNLTFNIEYGDNIKLVAEFNSWGNGGWKKDNSLRFTVRNACSDYTILKPFIDELRIKSGMPLHSCPLEAKRYELKGLDTRVINNISLPVFPIPTMWKMHFYHYEKSDGRTLNCKIYILESKPKVLKKH